MNQVTTVLDHDLIEAVRRHPDLYRKPTLGDSLTWCNIARQINSDAPTCRSKWFEIRHNYAYLKGIIRDRWELESVLRVHPKTSMYFDGSLNFFDPYIHIMKKTPKYITKRYEWIDSYSKVYNKRRVEMDNNLTLVTQEMVQAALVYRNKENHLDTPNMKYLMEVIGTTISQCLNDKENFQATQPIDLEEINFEDSEIMDPLDEASVDYCIENKSMIGGKNAAAGGKNILTNAKVTIPSDNFDIKEEEPDSDNITKDCNKIILATDVKTFFSDLVDFVSENFTLEKQKKLQRRVTQLVCELYADSDSE